MIHRKQKLNPRIKFTISAFISIFVLMWSLTSMAEWVPSQEVQEFLSKEEFHQEIKVPYQEKNYLEQFLEEADLTKDPEYSKFQTTKTILNSYGRSGVKIPSDYAKAIEGNDAPSGMIQELHLKSRQFWSDANQISHLLTLNSELTPYLKQVDLNIIDLKNLNLKAAEVWDQLVQCNQNNPDLARLRYMMAAFNYSLCEGELETSVTSQNMLQQMRDLTLNFQAYYTYIDLQWAEYISVKQIKTISEKIFVNLHPLLVQTLINQWSLFAAASFDSDQKYKNVSFEAGSRLSQWNSLNTRLMIFNQDPNHVMNELDQKWTQSFKEDIQFHWLVNSVAILTVLNRSSDFNHPCGIYGLWPLFNRSVLVYRYFFVNSLSNGSFINNLRVRATENCQDTAGDYDSPIPTFYTSNLPVHREMLIRMNYVYSNFKWDTRSEGQRLSDEMAQSADATLDSLEDGYEALENNPITFLPARILHGAWNIITFKRLRDLY